MRAGMRTMPTQRCELDSREGERANYEMTLATFRLCQISSALPPCLSTDDEHFHAESSGDALSTFPPRPSLRPSVLSVTHSLRPRPFSIRANIYHLPGIRRRRRRSLSGSSSSVSKRYARR